MSAEVHRFTLSYGGLSTQLYSHESVKLSAKEYVNGMTHTNGIESVWAVMKRGYNGVYHTSALSIYIAM